VVVGQRLWRNDRSISFGEFLGPFPTIRQLERSCLRKFDKSSDTQPRIKSGTTMKQTLPRHWDGLNSDKKDRKFFLDQAFVLGGLAVLIFAYIIFRFIFPLIDKGVLW
jgi:hypothetical protein